MNIKDSSSYADDLAGSTSYPTIGRYENQRPNMMASILINEENGCSNSVHLFNEQAVNAHFTGLKDELHICSSLAGFIFPETKGRSSSSWSRDGSIQVVRDSCPAVFSIPSLLQGHGANQLNISSSRLPPSWKDSPIFRRSTHLGHVYESFDKMANSTICDVEMSKIHNASSSMENIREGSQRFSNAAQSFLMTKKMRIDLSHVEPLIVDSTNSTKAKGIALFEMLTVPTSEGKQSEDSRPLLSPSSIEDGDDGVRSYTHVSERRNDLFLKTYATNIDALQTQISQEGISSDGLRKDRWFYKLTEDQSASASLLGQATSRDVGIELADTKLLCPVSPDKTAGNSEFSMSRRECKNTNQGFSHVQSPCISNSSCVIENLLQAESCSRWLKRFRCRSFDSPANGSKKSKTGDGPSSGEGCSFLGRELNYKTSSSLKEKQVLDENKKLIKSMTCSSAVSTEKMCSWIQRWRCKNTQTTQAQVRLAGPVLHELPNSNIAPGNYERKQFPSVATMALMGRAMKQFRTSVFQRKGSSVVWNIEGL